ncbi:MAG: hypothetical protein JWP97_3573 [Labilithrix sp.]|nr:hypothetical protein [Labilithrix sp.]
MPRPSYCEELMAMSRNSSMPPAFMAAAVATMVGCAAPTEPPPSPIARSSQPVSVMPAQCQGPGAATPEELEGAHGMWVWSTANRLADPRGAERIIESSHEAGLSEVYLSVNNGVLRDKRLPALMDALGASGLRVEALMGEANWYQAEHRPEMLARIDEVAAFNKEHAAGFAAVHLDVEPHQLEENKNNHAFLPELAQTLAEATAHAASLCMSTSADLPRFALDEQGPAFAQAVPRLFVMLYQLKDSSPDWLTAASGEVLDHTFRGLAGEQRGRLVISLRIEDYPGTLETMMSTLDQKHGNDSRYGGWAIHDEAKYRVRFRL